MNTIMIIAIILFGVPLVFGVIGVIVNRIKKGSWWEGQGFGKK